jgi:hypothetical protein
MSWFSHSLLYLEFYEAWNETNLPVPLLQPLPRWRPHPALLEVQENKSASFTRYLTVFSLQGPATQHHLTSQGKPRGSAFPGVASMKPVVMAGPNGVSREKQKGARKPRSRSLRRWMSFLSAEGYPVLLAGCQVLRM